ncbi:hypothetical protein M8J76_002515 [Diaphorina citri]|nr:hypothetical protein M8J76_002515 [Diaphorina citri]
MQKIEECPTRVLSEVPLPPLPFITPTRGISLRVEGKKRDKTGGEMGEKGLDEEEEENEEGQDKEEDDQGRRKRRRKEEEDAGREEQKDPCRKGG